MHDRRVRIVRSRLRDAFLGASALALLATTFCGAAATSGCNCDAICSADVEASGPLVVPEGSPALHVRYCVARDCHELDLRRGDWDGTGEPPPYDGCADDTVSCELERGRLVVRRTDEDGESEELEELEEDDVVTVEVTDTSTGEVILDERMRVQEVEEEDLCGTTCYGATVSWQ